MQDTFLFSFSASPDTFRKIWLLHNFLYTPDKRRNCHYCISVLFHYNYRRGIYMTATFDDWTSYDDWLIENYPKYNIYKVNEVDGKIEIEYCDKGDLQKIIDGDKSK